MSYVSTFNALNTSNTTAGQKLVLSVIASFERAGSGKAWPSVATIAKRASLSARTVNYHIASLIKLGYIQRIYRSGRSAITRLFIGETPAKIADTTPAKIAEKSVIPESVNQIQRVAEPATTDQQHQHTTDTAAVSPPLCFEIEQPQTEQPDQHQAIQEIESLPDYATQLQVFANSQYAPNEAPKTPYSASNESDKGTGLASVSAPAVEHQAEVPATEYQATSEAADPVDAAWAEVPAQVIADLQAIRCEKRKKKVPTKTEIQSWYSIALAEGWTLPQIVYAMVLKNWSRVEPGWLQHVPRPQMTATGAPAAPPAPKVWQPTPHTPASPSTVAKMKTEISKMKAKWASEDLAKRSPGRQQP